MQTDDFDYCLPQELIAQEPLSRRDASRLLVLHRSDGSLQHKRFNDLLACLNQGDILVANDSRVIPARLYGRKSSGGRVELLLLEQLSERCWKCLVGGSKLVAGTTVSLDYATGARSEIVATILSVHEGPLREICFSQEITAHLEEFGHTPLPPYIHRKLEDPERYQTVFSRPPGSAAAPTAGLHFSPDLLLALRERGVTLAFVTLHVGLDTFKPVEVSDVRDHTIHSEWASLSPEVAKQINEAKLAGGRVIAVGTTTVRTLETAALRSAGLSGSLRAVSQLDAAGTAPQLCPWRPVAAFEGQTDLFIYPGFKFRAVDGMITNFHLPRSSLLMLVSAFAGRESILDAYGEAIKERYRFYSLGDAMLIL